MIPLEGLRLALKVAIGHNTHLLSLTPEQLLELIDRRSFTNLTFTDIEAKPLDVCYIIENLQECLNCLLDARKKLIMLGIYKLDTDYASGETRESEIQIRARTQISEPLEEDEDSDCDPTYIPPNSSMEI